MLSARSVKRWYQWHKWSSLICTVFLLMLCITGLPLIFYDELDTLLSGHKQVAELPADTPFLNHDEIVTIAKQAQPDRFVQLLYYDHDDTNTVLVGLHDLVQSPMGEAQYLKIDNRTGEILAQQRGDQGFMAFLRLLHEALFMGQGGKLFLGFMALLFLISILSGVVIYAPFMRDRSFATVRCNRGSDKLWLDKHNSLGIIVMAWMFIVGATGMINTWGTFIMQYWQYTEMTAMIAENAPPTKQPANPQQLTSVQAAIDTAQAAGAGWKLAFLAWPGTELSSQQHYAVFLRGTTTLTSRMLKPVLIEAETGQLTATRSMPWYVSVFLLSQPLHFGDYAGLPLKILWVLLNLLTIVILLSGLYLWWKKRNNLVELE